mgnify:CR=1 FL=1
MPFLHQEGHVLAPWKPCSRMLKGLFFVQEERVLEKRRIWIVKYPDIFSLLEYLSFFTENIFFSHRTHSGPSPNPSPNGEGSSMWGYPYRPACTYHRVFSLTELTDLTEHICAQFRTHRRPSAYRYHRTLLLKMAVRFCEIGWLNVSVKLCVFCSSVLFCEKKNIVGVCG